MRYHRLAILLALAFSLLLVGVSIKGIERVRASGAPVLTYEDPGGLYRYAVTRVGSKVFKVRVAINSSSLDTLKKYAELNRLKALELATTGERRIPVIVTFLGPVSQDELRKLAESVGMQVKSYTGRGIAASGKGPADKVTFQLGPKDEVLLDLAQIEQRLGQLNARLAGFSSVKGYVDSQGLLLLLNDPRVFLTDTMGFSIEQEVRKRLALPDDSEIRISHHSPYWFIEKYLEGAKQP